MSLLKPFMALLFLLGPLAQAQSNEPFKPGPYFAPWTRRVEQGDPVAMWELAEEYRRGGLPGRMTYELEAKAAPLLAKAAEQGDPAAMGCYADWLFEKDRNEEALGWAQKAAAAGELRGYEVMGRIYADTTSPLRDQAKSAEADAQYERLQLEKAKAGTLPTHHFRYGVGLSRQEKGWILLARAEQGDREAQFILGSELMSKSPESAVKWGFVPKGTTPDMLTLAIITKTARDWLIKAAEHDHWEAAMRLGDQTRLAITETPGIEPSTWVGEAERMLGGRNDALNMYYEGHPDDPVEGDPDAPDPVEPMPGSTNPSPAPSVQKAPGKVEKKVATPKASAKERGVKNPPSKKTAKKTSAKRETH